MDEGTNEIVETITHEPAVQGPLTVAFGSIWTISRSNATTALPVTGRESEGLGRVSGPSFSVADVGQLQPLVLPQLRHL